MDTATVQHVEDQLAIRELSARYNHAIDDGRVDDWVATFVPEGTFESTALGTHTGLDALRTFAVGYTAAFTGRHCTSDYVVDIDGRDATQRCYLILVDNSATPKVAVTAVYEDVLRRTDDGWRFVHRRVAPDTAIH